MHEMQAEYASAELTLSEDLGNYRLHTLEFAKTNDADLVFAVDTTSRLENKDTIQLLLKQVT